MLVLFAAMLIALMGFCGLAVDSGRLQLRQIQIQEAADAGAMAGAAALANGSAGWQTEASNDASADELAVGITGASNAAQQGASSGTYAGNTSAVQMKVTAVVPTYFLGLLGGTFGQATLTATAVAVGSSGACLYASATPGLTGSSPVGEGIEFVQTSVSSPCNIYSAPGIEINQATVNGGGTVMTSGASSLSSVSSSNVSPAVQYGVGTMGDPLAYLAEPTVGTCTVTQSIFGAGANGSNNSYNPTLSPGVYCNGLTAGGANVTFSPGLYIIEGGASFSNGTFVGTGVTFYFTKNSSGSYGTVNWSGVSFGVSAPTSSANGGYPGILIFADRAWSGSNQDFVFQNGSSLGQNGIIYVPHAGFKNNQCALTGNQYFGIVAGNFSLINGSLSLSSNYSSLSGGSPLHSSVSLVQ